MRRNFYKKLGMTLAEVLISFALFSFIGLVLVGVITQGTEHRKRTGDLLTAETGLIAASNDLNNIVRNSSLALSSCGYDPNSGCGWIAVPVSAKKINGKYRIDLINYVIPQRENSVQDESSPNQEDRQTEGYIDWNCTVIYFVAYNSAGECDQCPDGVNFKLCPHKFLIRRLISGFNGKEDAALQARRLSGRQYMPTADQTSANQDKIIAKNVIFFYPEIKNGYLSCNINLLKPDTSGKISIDNYQLEHSLLLYNQEEDNEAENEKFYLQNYSVINEIAVPAFNK